MSLRAPSDVMRLARLGAGHQTRLSFMRVVLRGLKRGGWQVDCPEWSIDAHGVGHAVYRARGQGEEVNLVAFAHDLPADQRSDRVIAQAWDATFALVDGPLTDADIARLRANVPLQEAGRVSDRELVLSRANRSVRLWDHVVGCLSEGQQPDAALIDEVGYLMRTTAVYGSGKFGAADHAALKGRPLLDGPFRAEMLAVWLIRTFVMDLVEHAAARKGGGNAVKLDPDLRRRCGIGNSTGLGMAPFLANHPDLLNAWITARETALARVRALPLATNASRAHFQSAVTRTEKLLARWTTQHPYQVSKVTELRTDIARLSDHIATGAFDQPRPWEGLMIWAEDVLSVEGQELLVSLMLEPHGDLVDDLAEDMGADELARFRIDGAMSTQALRALIKANFDWCLPTDFDAAEGCARFWYVSEAKLEPRLGERHLEDGAECEQPLDIARAVKALAHDLGESNGSVATFLLAHPQHRFAVRRVQLSQSAPYGEIRDNLIGADLMPVDMLRCKLAFFGATRFDPRSDRWVRITMFQDAPFPDELYASADDDWSLPPEVA